MNALEIIVAAIETAAFLVLICAHALLVRDYRRFIRRFEEDYAIIREVQKEAQRLLDSITQESGKE